MKKYILYKDTSPKKISIDYEKDLNEEQLRVVNHKEGPVLVIAGAGSGKTRVVTYRVARLLEDGVPPHNILLLTFTNKAAREMLHRVEHLLKIDTRSIWGGTFHHIGNMILRIHSDLLGLDKDFTIFDNEDAKDLIEIVLKEMGLSGKGYPFPKGTVLKEIFSYAINTLSSIEEAILERYPYLYHLKDEIVEVYENYSKKKKKTKAVDFDDLLYLWHKILKDHEDLRKYYAKKFAYILVDEYQDTNKIQAEIIDFMGLINRNVMVVGDDAQSIYSFRGANFRNIFDFPKRYEDCTVYKLETNYRSTPEILNFANESISHNLRQFKKVLKSVKRSGLIPVVTGLKDVVQQAEFVAQRILELKDEGIPFNEIAVLYRAHYHSMEIQMELTRRDIPFEVRSGLKFFEQAHIKDVVSFLRVCVNEKDEISWKRLLKIFPRVGKKTAEQIFDYISSYERPVDLFIEKRIGEKLKKIPKETIELWSELFRDLRDLKSKEAPSEMINAVIRKIYGEYLKYNYPDYESRLDDLEQLSNFASKYYSVETFLSELSLMSGLHGEESIYPGSDEERVILSTIHQAKGLEWRVVFVVWCVEGRFPNSKSMDEEAIEEERRLFYVACTRAMDELYVCYPMTYYEKAIGYVILRPSRFITELNPSVYEEWDVSESF
ncbi:MAG: ATP-dependent helicase [Desulfobacterota bacterium]|nr:ATP-dependent helicase [Thermodesulfobacteriota bacterium]MDW8001469.1 ATP-dependent helicase [Deltaproteobacteria bacterium]